MKTFPAPHGSCAGRLGALLLCSALCAACASRPGQNAEQLVREQALSAAAQRSGETPPDTRAAYFALIQQIQGRRLYFASLAHIAAFEKQYGKAADIELLRGDALRETHQSDAALTVYRSLLEGDTASAAYHGIGLIQASAGQTQEATRSLAQAVSLAPTDATLLGDYGYACLWSADLDAARVALAQAAELAPGNRKTLANLALYLFLDDNPAAAARVIARAELSPSVAAAIQRRADAIRDSWPNHAQAARSVAQDASAAARVRAVSSTARR